MRLVKYRGKYAVYLDGERRSLRTPDRVLAEQRFEDFKKSQQIKKETISEIVKAYLEEKKQKASIGGMQDAWKALEKCSNFAALRPDQITKSLCRVYLAKRTGMGCSTGTVRKELGVLRQAIRWHDPRSAPQIELPSAPPPIERYLTKEEYNKLLEKCKHQHLRLFVQLAIATAGRKSAILDLTWDRVDFKDGLIRLGRGDRRAKGRANVPITESLRQALLKAKEDASCDYVVSYAGERVKNVAKGFREAAKDAGLTGVTPHTLRHTAATWMVQAGTSIQDVAAYLGHTNPATTFRVYAKFSPSYLRKAAQALEV